MIKSMTGFGSSSCTCESKTYSVEIKSINSKTLDFSQKLPSEIKDKEFDIKLILSNLLERGKIELTITSDQTIGTCLLFDNEVAKMYFLNLKSLSQNIGVEIDDSQLFSLAVKMPDVFSPKKDVIDEQTWETIASTIKKACLLLDQNRISEGRSLEEDFKLRISLILKYLEDVEALEDNRIQLKKDKLLKQLTALGQEIDENRFEQELILYLDKFDITEEKVRLKKHCDYFIETMTSENQNGKKLGFISQEIGREVNTLGSKASDADIQKLVVMMKAELEKIKEQLANVL